MLLFSDGISSLSKHGSSVEVIIVSVWRCSPPVRQAWTYSTADNSTAMRRQINCLTPAANHFIPPGRQLRGNPEKKRSLKTSYRFHPWRRVHHWIFYVRLLCRGGGPPCLWLWEVNEIKASFSSVPWYLSLSPPPNPKPRAPANQHRSVWGETHHASVMVIILFAEAILGAFEAAWKLPLQNGIEFLLVKWASWAHTTYSNPMLLHISAYIYFWVAACTFSL